MFTSNNGNDLKNQIFLAQDCAFLFKNIKAIHSPLGQYVLKNWDLNANSILRLQPGHLRGNQIMTVIGARLEM